MASSGPKSLSALEAAMFNSPLYDPKAKWRAEPATDAQLKALGLTIAAATAIIKGQAAELISCSLPVSSDETAFLKFFDVKLPEPSTQQDAYSAFATIIIDPANRLKWEARAAAERERLIIEYMENAAAAQTATVTTAADKLKAYAQMPSTQAKYARCLEWLKGWQQVEDTHSRRESFITDHYESLARDPEACGLQQVELDLVRKAIELLETEHGTTLKVLEQDTWFYLRVADAMRRLAPSVSPHFTKAHQDIHCPWINEVQR
jgi:hypothetical protein